MRLAYTRHLTLISIFIVSNCSHLMAQTKKSNSVFDPSNLSVQWEVVENNHQNQFKFLSAFTFYNKGKARLPASGWTFYFDLVRSVDSGSVTGNVKIQHVNGDLFRLTPLNDFKGIAPGDSLRIEFVADDWVVNFTDAPLGLYWVWDNDPGKGISIDKYTIKPSTEPKQYMRFAGDKVGLITPELIFDQNKTTTDIPSDSLPKIFPTPISYKSFPEEFVLNASVTIQSDPEFLHEADYLATEISKTIGKKLPVNSGTTGTRIILQKSNIPTDAYTLIVNKNGATISASSASGIFYGIQSLKSLLPPNAWSGKQQSLIVPGVEVSDAPRFGYRSFMLDVGRNFHKKEEILKVLDLLALYKLNIFHFHLTEDEGWRLEIPGLPELTEVGARRGHTADGKQMLPPSYGSGPDPSKGFGSGYYTRSDFIEILKYANDRHISVVPEIETPGHARAAVKSMQARYEKYMKQGNREEAERYLLYSQDDPSVYSSAQLWSDNVIDVSLPSAYRFIEKVLDELIGMYHEANVPLSLVHFGGDEVPAGVWEKSPAYLNLKNENPSIQSTNDLWYYYYGKVNDMLQSRHLKLYGWEEMAMRKTQLDGAPSMIPNPDFVKDHLQVDVWNNVLGWGAEDLAYKLANAGYKVVLSNVSNLYFDMAYNKSFEEPGYYWGGFLDIDKPFYFIPFDYFKNSKEDRMGGPLDKTIFIGKQRLTEYGSSNIIGIQGLLWSENMLGPERVEYMLLPKLLGMAERAWAKNPDWAVEKDSIKAAQLYRKAWDQFVNVVGKRELPRLDNYAGGFHYRIPTAGAKLIDGKVWANVQFPGLTIRYTSDGSEPNVKSKLYSGPIVEKGIIKLRVFDSRGRGSRTVMLKVEG